MSNPGWMLALGLLASNPKRILRIQIEHAMILHINLRHAVIGCWQKKAGIKPNFQRPGLQLTIPIRTTILAIFSFSPQTKVSFPNNCSGISSPP